VSEAMIFNRLDSEDKFYMINCACYIDRGSVMCFTYLLD